MKCPNCSKDDTIRCAMAYLRGSSQGAYSGTSSSRGTFLTPSYEFGLSSSNGEHSGESQAQTSLARALQPPEPVTLKEVFGLWIGLGVVTYIVLGIGLCLLLTPLGVQQNTVLNLDSWATGLLSLAYLVFSVRYYVLGNRDYHRDLERYKREWICLRCGHRWIPN